MKSLPARPSLESLRKQAKRLARDIAAGDARGLARARAHLPRVDASLTQRNAQLVIAREYGYAGWQDLVAEVQRRIGGGLDWAAGQARRAIHDNDVERLKQLLAEHPALLSWLGDDDHTGLLGFATGAYGDAFGAERERWFTRAASAELLIDAGATVAPAVCEGLLHSRAVGLLLLFQRKGLLPRTLPFFAALGELAAVRRTLDENANDLATVNDAFITACRFERAEVASLLLERAIAFDPQLGRDIDRSVGRDAFITFLIAARPDPTRGAELGPWRAFVVGQVQHALDAGDVTTFVDVLRRDPWLLDDDFVWLQQRLIEAATLRGREDFIVALLDLRPALLRRQPPPPSQAFEFALTYAHTQLVPLLARIWTVPDDLPYAAGMGNLARVKQCVDESTVPPQQVLDTALAFAVINHHFDVADFLLEHGADINTNWNSHEPASILHHLVFEDDYESMQYLVDRGIDLTIRDYRWNATARGWALYAKKDEKMAEWLEQAERAGGAGAR